MVFCMQISFNNPMKASFLILNKKYTILIQAQIKDSIIIIEKPVLIGLLKIISEQN